MFSASSRSLKRIRWTTRLFLGLLDLIQTDPPVSPPTMIQIKQGDATIGAAFYRDRHLVVTRDLEEVTEALATHLREHDIDVPGVAGPSSSAEQFAGAWSRISGCESKLTVEMGLYWLKTLIWPAPVAGHLRPMVTDDIPLVAQWVFEFQRKPHHTKQETLTKPAKMPKRVRTET